METKLLDLSDTIRHITYIICAMIFSILIVALIGVDISHEANIGEFAYTDFNDNWRISVNRRTVEESVSFPYRPDFNIGDEIVLSNILPMSITDGMTFMYRTSINGAEIYVDDTLRESYGTDREVTENKNYLSTFIVTDLCAADAGKEIKIRIPNNNNRSINGVVIGYGNNQWFGILKDNMVLLMLSVFITLLGIMVIVLYLFMAGKVHTNRSIFYLGFLMTTMGVWMLSESRLRQMIFRQTSLISYVAYLSIELVGVLTMMYFDEVQHEKYHKIYLGFEVVLTSQIIINSCLHMSGIMTYHKSLVLSHIEFVIGIVAIIISILTDLINNEIKTYKIVAIGMGIFLACGTTEIISMYLIDNHVFGAYLIVGLIALLFSTIIQIAKDTILAANLREKEERDVWISTMETIASTIDAKDEYTGGHSNRVGDYVSILAREMADEYGFTKEDIVRIRYIGLMHDIGKIGVADTILNKTGKLSDEEFTLMKKHVEIGDNLLSGMDKNTKDLVAGVRHHHERFDGRGYPDGLKGSEIPLIARMLCLADCYDAMTSNRVYRKRLSDEEVRNEIERCAGTQFDPELTAIFVSLIDKGEIYPITIEGMEVNEKGRVRKSSLLEERLQKDIAKGELTILNPSHVRMVCYIMKLAEYRDRQSDVFLIEKSADNNSEEYAQLTIDDILKEYIKKQDISIQYTETMNVVVLFDRSYKEAKNVCNSLSKVAEVTVLERRRRILKSNKN